MKGRIFGSLFALPFAAVGVWMLSSVSGTVYDAWQMRDWAQVEAQLVADNIGDYQQDIGRNLGNAHARGQPIVVFVNPDDPAEAIIGRGIRWGMIGFKMIFVIVFGGVGFGLLYAVWKAPNEKDQTDPAYADKPWLLNDDWQNDTIKSGSRASMWGAWAFAILWNAISSVAPFLAYREIVKNDNWIGLIALLFPLVGTSLLVWATRRTLEWRRFGPAPVTLDPFPGSIGGHVGGMIDLNLPFDPASKFQLTLTNIHSYESGSGKNRSQKEKAKWQDAIVAHAEPGGKGTRLTFRFEVPEGLNESDTDHDGSYYLWRLNLKAELPGTDLDRDYDLPVYATAQQSRHLSNRAVEKSRREQSSIDDQSVNKIVNLSVGTMGKRMFFPMGRYLSSSIGGLLVGAIFAAVGWFLIVQEGHAIFGSVFGGIGALVAVWCLYMIFNSLEVSQDSMGVITTRRLIGIPIKRHHVRRDEIVSLKKHTSFQTQSGGKHIIYYKVHAIDRAGNKFIVGEGFKGESEANAAIRLIGREFGLRVGLDERRTDDRRKNHQNEHVTDQSGFGLSLD